MIKIAMVFMLTCGFLSPEYSEARNKHNKKDKAEKVEDKELRKSCRKEFGKDIAECAQSLKDKKREKKKEKVAALKACHAEAREDLKVCLAGDSGSEQPPNPVPDNSACIATCQSNLTSGQLLCAENYDLSQCSGEASCEQLVTQLHANCMNSAQAAYDSCALSCQ